MKENVSCASSEIHLLSIIETLGHKFEVLLSIFCGIKITLEWITQEEEATVLELPLSPKTFSPVRLCLELPFS